MEGKKILSLQEQIRQGDIDALKLIFDGASKSDIRWIMKKVGEEAATRKQRIPEAFQSQRDELGQLVQDIDARLKSETAPVSGEDIKE